MKNNPFFIILPVVLLVAVHCCHAQGAADKCPINFPVITFDPVNVTLTAASKTRLKSIATSIKKQPGTLLFVNTLGLSTKSGQNNCNRKLMLVKTYLSEVEGIRMNRIIVNCEFTDSVALTNEVSFTCEQE